MIGGGREGEAIISTISKPTRFSLPSLSIHLSPPLLQSSCISALFRMEILDRDLKCRLLHFHFHPPPPSPLPLSQSASRDDFSICTLMQLASIPLLFVLFLLKIILNTFSYPSSPPPSFPSPIPHHWPNEGEGEGNGGNGD